MLSLPELQARAAAIRHGGGLPRDLEAEIAADGLPPERRLGIYRNHFRLTLADALAANFAATRRLLGEDCFAALARRYVERDPPRDPRLLVYGRGFAGFLAAQPGLGAVPYAPDLARLEQAMREAAHAPDAAALSPERLRRLQADAAGELALGMHPAWRLVVSRWPLPAVWCACQPDAPPPEPLDLDAGPARLLVGRDAGGDAVWTELALGELVFLRWLKAAYPLAAAARAAAYADPRFDLAGTLASCLGAGVFAAEDPDPDPC